MNENEREDVQMWMESGRSKFVFDEHVLDRPIKSIGMRPSVVVAAGTPLADAIRQMRERRIGSTLVTRDGKLVGIFTERDLMMRVVLGEASPSQAKVDELMRPNPEVLTPEHPLAYALRLMSHGGYRHVPLVDAEGRSVGIISVRDIVDYLAEFFRDHVLNLPPTPDSIASHREGG